MAMKIRLIDVVVGIVLFPILVFVAFSLILWQGKPTLQKHLKSVEWLPASASDVSCFERKGFGWIKIYECSIEEADVKALAKQNGWTFVETNDVFVPFREALGEEPLREVDGEKLDLARRALWFDRTQPNGGGTTAIYDRDLQRLLVKSSHR